MRRQHRTRQHGAPTSAGSHSHPHQHPHLHRLWRVVNGARSCRFTSEYRRRLPGGDSRRGADPREQGGGPRVRTPVVMCVHMDRVLARLGPRLPRLTQNKISARCEHVSEYMYCLCRVHTQKCRSSVQGNLRLSLVLLPYLPHVLWSLASPLGPRGTPLALNLRSSHLPRSLVPRGRLFLRTYIG